MRHIKRNWWRFGFHQTQISLLTDGRVGVLFWSNSKETEGQKNQITQANRLRRRSGTKESLTISGAGGSNNNNNKLLTAVKFPLFIERFV